MNARRRAAAAVVLLAMSVSACGGWARFSRPEGDGGWSPERRAEEIARRAALAGVEGAPTAPLSVESSAPAVHGVPELRTALEMALSGNRRIAEERQQLDAARENVF